MKTLASLVGILVLASGCGHIQENGNQFDIIIDGSSTVYPIAKLSVESYQKNETDVDISLSYSGTSSGLCKLCSGEIDLANASRKITREEAAACRENGVDYRELLIAKDGIAVVVHANNIWVDYLTVEELMSMWRAESEGQINSWSDIREGWPERHFKLYGPGSASGTYGYFARAVIGEQATRGDYVASENDEVLVRGVSDNADGIGFFGLGYYRENNNLLKLVPIRDENVEGSSPTIPSPETIKNGTYQPLSRNMYVYVAEKSLKKRMVLEFADFFFQHATKLVSSAGYIPQPEAVYREARHRLRTTIPEN